MNVIDIAGTDTCMDVAKRIGIPPWVIREQLNLDRLVREEDLISVAPLVNCFALANLDPEHQESLFDAALVLPPRAFEEVCNVIKGN